MRHSRTLIGCSKVLYDLPFSTDLLHYDQVPSEMGDRADQPSRAPCAIGECVRTLFDPWLDTERAPLIHTSLDSVTNLVPSSERPAIAHQRGVFSIERHDGIHVLRVVGFQEICLICVPGSALDGGFNPGSCD